MRDVFGKGKVDVGIVQSVDDEAVSLVQHLQDKKGEQHEIEGQGKCHQPEGRGFISIHG
jgi:hypothetical protein